ncbi:MAG: dTDP-4-dehydrorhamnose 3,5-epimerase [Lunatimonas sp.]|uniref:dTDP-4-dehydrorhamnose 3,5-epimerase n=1 Tax=Lunatimonas sp. TaxID=2060141 RepID=UPI00263B8B6F|nr:dTDP-4-dehydrorhamnose 3,5-epimerase [Lunatimonas sp.]MCC5937645.1 dTDP-4-dehydrorhamnose 3,5-epimerase [Lunatimonas sp.]
MHFEETILKGAYQIKYNKIGDERGFFTRTFCQREFQEHGLTANVAQGNLSFSKKSGTFRGFHYQVAPHQETKLVQCIQGSIFDIIIDLRTESPTFKKWYGTELSAINGTMLYVPKGFAHGFITLEDDTLVSYLVSEFYSPTSERGIKWDDPQFGIQLPIPISVISEKDLSHAYFEL